MPVNAKLIPHTLSVMEAYLGRKPMAIGTGSMRESAKRLLEHAGLLEHFDCLVTSDDVAQHKPNPDTFLIAAQLMQAKPKYCIVFEDHNARFASCSCWWNGLLLGYIGWF